MPQDGRYYLNDEDCIWTVEAPIGYVIQLTWLSFDLEAHTRCRHDYVQVYENYMSPGKELIGTYV